MQKRDVRDWSFNSGGGGGYIFFYIISNVLVTELLVSNVAGAPERYLPYPSSH